MNENLLDQEPKESEDNAESNIILVTGGTGLVGSHLIELLVKSRNRVRALYRSNIPDIKRKENVEWVKGDILDVISLEEAMKGAAQVYHCAAIVSFDKKQKRRMFAANIDGTVNVVNEAINAGVKKLCYVSSVAAFGKGNKEKQIDESLTWTEDSSNSNYAKSKFHAEAEVWRGIGEGLKAVIVNPSIILGASDWNNGSAKIFKTAFEEFPWYTEGITGFVDVLDVVSVMKQLMESDISGQRFIISAEDWRYKDIFTSIAIAFGKKPPYKKVSPFLANLVTRFESAKSMFTGEEPLLTKETAEAAQTVIHFNNSKIKKYLPSFVFTPVSETIKRVCKEIQEQQRF